MTSILLVLMFMSLSIQRFSVILISFSTAVDSSNGNEFDGDDEYEW